MSTTLAEMQNLFADFPNKMREIKKQRNLTNQQIADATGIPYNNVARFFSGSSVNPQLYNGMALCKFFGASPNELFGFPEHVSKPDELTEAKLEHAEEKLKYMGKIVRYLSLVVIVLLVIVLLYVLVFDVGNSEFGFFSR